MTMKPDIKYILGYLPLIFTACHENVTEGAASLTDAMEFSAGLEQQYITRANDGGFADDDQIGVFIVNYKNGEAQDLQVTGNHADNVRFTYDETSNQWTGSYQLYWKDKVTPVDAYGYYPFDAELSSVTAYPFSVQRNQRDRMTTGRQLSGYETSDFLWAKAEKKLPSNGKINLQHHHLMAGVKVTLKEGVGFAEGEWNDISKIVMVDNTVLSSTINLQNGQVTCGTGSAISIIPQQSGDVYRSVVIPQSVAAQQSVLTMTIDNKTYHHTRNEDMVYYSGKLHQFTFEVQKSLETGDFEFTLINESITPWENDPESHNGEAREYVVVHVNEFEFLGDVIEKMGLDPSKIVNLKITGYLGKISQWYDSETGQTHYSPGNRHFDYIREKMTNLEALNLKDVVKINGTANGNNLSWRQIEEKAYDSSWNPYEQDVDNFNGCLPCGAFENMKNLRYFTWPDCLDAIGEMAFPGSGLCGSLILPEGLKFIGGGAFVAYGHGALNLTGELYIPPTIEYIGDGAFGQNDGNRNMCFFTNELVLPSRMKYLGEGAFTGCTLMTGSIHVPDGITEMNNAWPDQIGGPCVIPQGVKVINGIPRGATNVFIPNGVEEIAGRGFAETLKLRCNIHLPSTIKKIGEAAFYSEWGEIGITHINLPEGLEIIEGSTFHGCSNLQDTIIIPSTVTQIRENAFHHCRQIQALILPAGLQGIMDNAFSGCYSLDYIECKGSEPPAIEESTFSGVEKDNFTVVVPEGAVESYKAAPYWSEFKRISAYRNFVCRPMQAKLLNKQNVRDVVLNANDSWTVSDCPSWIHVSPSSGYKKTELKITIDAMPHNQGDRSGAVTFRLGRNDEDGNEITCTYTVKQFDYEHEEDGVIHMQSATKGQRGGIDILFCGDGYDAEDIANGTYYNDMQQEMEYFFGVEPYKTYRQYFNVSAAVAMSYESGIVDSPDKWRNTKFSITYGAGNNGRLSVPFETIGSYVLQDVPNSPVTSDNIGRSLIICVPNSDSYEGLTAMYSDGSAIAVCPMSKMPYPNDARGIIQHEAGGHGWAKLDDEYVYHRDYIQTCTCICCSHVDGVNGMHAMGWGRNVSLTGKYGTVEWKHLLGHPNYSDIVDIYEGAHMHAQGIFRSEPNSCMNNNVPYFSTWSRQLAVERIKEAAGETFSLEDFVANDSRAYGDKFLTRGQTDTPWQQVKAIHSDHHGPVIKKGSITDYLKKKGGLK